jgi:hypothetical protein
MTKFFAKEMTWRTTVSLGLGVLLMASFGCSGKTDQGKSTVLSSDDLITTQDFLERIGTAEDRIIDCALANPLRFVIVNGESDYKTAYLDDGTKIIQSGCRESWKAIDFGRLIWECQAGNHEYKNVMVSRDYLGYQQAAVNLIDTYMSKLPWRTLNCGRF